jgi:hypothetical protein
MIGISGSHAKTFLLVFATITTVFFALPIFFKPILWARAMRWNIHNKTSGIHLCTIQNTLSKENSARFAGNTSSIATR